MMTIYADDAVHVLPFAPDGMPDRVEGKRAISDWMHTVPGMLTFDGGPQDLRLYESGDALTAQWNSRGHYTDGSPAAMSYVAVMTFDGDHIVEYNDYMNPRGLEPIFGGQGTGGRRMIRACSWAMRGSRGAGPA